MLEKEYEENRKSIDKWTLKNMKQVIGVEFSSLTNYTFRFSSSSTPSDEIYDYWPGLLNNFSEFLMYRILN